MLVYKHLTIMNIDGFILIPISSNGGSSLFTAAPQKNVESSIILFLKGKKGNFDAPFKHFSENISEIVWWTNIIENSTNFCASGVHHIH